MHPKALSYLFYDIETTGLSKCFDQVLRFAAIRTDRRLNEIERHEISVRLNPDVIPSPSAVITHRIGINESLKGESELAAIQKIHALLNTPNTISVGYNTLGFDDEFLRFSFYKNLLPPYTHQYANQCGRMDIYPMTVMYHLFKPNHLNWPESDGKISLKLENLNASNQLANGQAHDAMVDVEVTLALAKRLYQDKKMWDYVAGYFQKQMDDQRIIQCDSYDTIANKNIKTGFMVDGKLGAQSRFIVPVIHCGQHQHYKNQSLWLRLDDDRLTDTTIENIPENTYVLRKKLAEQPLFLPFKERYLDLLSNDRKALLEQNKIWLANNSPLFSSICAHYQHEKYPEIPQRDADAALYDIGFPSREEESLFQKFHRANPDKKSAIASMLPNPVRKEQAVRIIGRHFPKALSSADKIQFDAYLASLLGDKTTPVDFRGEKKLTIGAALAEIKEIQSAKNLDNEQKKLLVELAEYLNKTTLVSLPEKAGNPD